MLEVEDNAPFNTILNQIHQRAREPAPICESCGTLARALSDESETRERRGIVCQPIDEFQQDRRRRMQEGVKERSLLAFGFWP